MIILKFSYRYGVGLQIDNIILRFTPPVDPVLGAKCAMVKATFDSRWQYLLTVTQDDIRKMNNLIQYSKDASIASKDLVDAMIQTRLQSDSFGGYKFDMNPSLIDGNRDGACARIGAGQRDENFARSVKLKDFTVTLF